MAVVKTCQIEGCGKHVLARGLCAAHYGRMRRHGDPRAGSTQPSTADPDRPAVCIIPGCEKPNTSLGYCATHYQRHREGRDLDTPVVERLQGDRFIDRNGYVCFMQRGHPEATTDRGRVLEHRAVLAEKLGRKLLPGEDAVHINGDRTDNRPKNLELRVTYLPTGQRPEDLLEWAREIIRRYG